MEDFWKNVALLAIGALCSSAVSIWSITKRPTFTQVEAMITKEHASISARFDRQDKLLEKLDRHLEETREKVGTILIDIEAQRQVRARKALSELDT